MIWCFQKKSRSKPVLKFWRLTTVFWILCNQLPVVLKSITSRRNCSKWTGIQYGRVERERRAREKQIKGQTLITSYQDVLHKISSFLINKTSDLNDDMKQLKTSRMVLLLIISYSEKSSGNLELCKNDCTIFLKHFSAQP